MHASVMERRTDEVRGVTRQRSDGRWQALDGGQGADSDGSVIPRQAPRHEAAPTGTIRPRAAALAGVSFRFADMA